MYLLDTQHYQGKMFGFFKMKDGKYRTLKMNWKNYLLFLPTADGNSIPSNQLVVGRAWGKRKAVDEKETIQFQRYDFVNPDDEITTYKQINAERKGSFFDYQFDIRMRFFEETRLVPYEFYDGSYGIGEEDYIDIPGAMSVISSEIEKKTEQFLSVMTIHVKIQSMDRNLIIPDYQSKLVQLHTGLELHKLKVLGENRIEYIVYIKNDVKHRVYIENGDEKVLILEFLKCIEEINPDVLQMFNFNELVFVYERCGKFEGMKERFMRVMNRMVHDEFTVHSTATLIHPRQVKRAWSEKYELSTSLLDFRPKSFDEIKYCKLNVYGRICVQLGDHFTKGIDVVGFLIVLGIICCWF